MEPIQLLNLALVVVGTLFTLLMAVIGWMGNKIYNKLESVEKQINEIEKELHEKILVLDRRVTRLEALTEGA
jgi:cell division protein FtsB